MIRERMAESCHSVSSELGEVQTQTRECNESMVTLLHETIGGRVARMLEALSKQKYQLNQRIQPTRRLAETRCNG